MVFHATKIKDAAHCLDATEIIWTDLSGLQALQSVLLAINTLLIHFIFNDGDYYIGEFKNGDRHGHGTYSFNDGRKYVGEYENNKRKGKGIEYTADGQISKEGIWADGQFVKKG